MFTRITDLISRLWGIRIIVLFLFLSGCLESWASRDFWQVSSVDGLCNDQVNSIFQDRTGYIWMGTNNGLARYDGYRFRNFYSDYDDSKTLSNGLVNAVCQDRDGLLWLRTQAGYCLFDPLTETAYRDVGRWMRSHDMQGVPDYVHADRQGNMWIFVARAGCYYMNGATGKVRRIASGRGGVPAGNVTDCSQQGRNVLFTFSTGEFMVADMMRGRIVWRGRRPGTQRVKTESGSEGCCLDGEGNIYLYSSDGVSIYSKRRQRWFAGLSDFMRDNGVTSLPGNATVQNISYSPDSTLWIATETRGLFVVDMKRKTVRNYLHDSKDPGSLPDNLVHDIFFDGYGGVWLSTSRNGVAYFHPARPSFPFYATDDIYTMTQDHAGTIWLGTNGNGVLSMDPRTFTITPHPDLLAGKHPQVVVASLTARDGTLWFGLFNGGLVAWRGAVIREYKTRRGALATNDIGALAEDHNGNIVIGTLGGGVQLLHPRTGRFTTYNTKNSDLRSDFVSSVFVTRSGNILAGTSQGLAIIRPGIPGVECVQKTADGNRFSSVSVSQVIEDHRGLIWVANMGGLDVYDPQTKLIHHVLSSREVTSSVVEDSRHDIWASVERSIIRVHVVRDKEGYDFSTSRYNYLDGLQLRRLNASSILLDRDGRVLVGGPDGVNVINPFGLSSMAGGKLGVHFSDLALSAVPVRVGEKYNGKVILHQTLDSSRRLTLRFADNTFTVFLSAMPVRAEERVEFEYRLLGLDSKWQPTAEGQPSVTFTHLPSGKYTLEVRVAGLTGAASEHVSRLSVTILPPFWRSLPAFILYFVALGLIVLFIWRYYAQRRKARHKIEQLKREKEQTEQSIGFIARLGHDLRTPLALIISPLNMLFDKEGDPEKRQALALVIRNATRLLRTLNQALDVRRMMVDKDTLRLVNGDVMELVADIVESFRAFRGKEISLLFTREPESLEMTFDDDKLDKIVMNLLSNAYKYTPDGGQVTVSVRLTGEPEGPDSHVGQVLEIAVSDNGQSVPEEEKPHLFDIYYQGSNRQGTGLSGSGMGLSIVRHYAVMHGGDVTVDNLQPSGVVFTVSIPYRYDASKPAWVRQERIEEPVYGEMQPGMDGTHDKALEVEEVLAKGEYEILVVDDNEDFRNFMALQLRSTYRVRTASNGREALEMIREHHPDVILSDVMMSGMDGNELCQRLKQDPKTQRIPFVMLTARLSSSHRLEALSSGADDYITKPFDFQLLHLRIANLIRWHNATPLGVKIDPKVKREEVTSADEALVERLTSYVEANLNSALLSVETLSEAVSMSRVNLYKRLLAATGHTPSEFIRLIRLRHAAQLLKESQLTVAEVAYRVGFNSPRYFSRYFKEVYHVMPSQYRKNETGTGDGTDDSDLSEDAVTTV